MRYSSGKTFKRDVYDAYVRMMCGNPLKVVAKFALSPDEGGEVSGRCLVFARLFCNRAFDFYIFFMHLERRNSKGRSGYTF